MLIPYGGLVIPETGAGTLALSTTAAAVTGWSAGNQDSWSREGCADIIPDAANNRIKVQAGVYMVSGQVSFVGGATAGVVARIRKNGTAVGGVAASTIDNSSGFGQVVIPPTIIEVKDSDNPKNLPTMGTPAGTFTGGAGAPDTLNTIDMTLEVTTSTDTVTIRSAALTVIKVG